MSMVKAAPRSAGARLLSLGLLLGAVALPATAQTQPPTPRDHLERIVGGKPSERKAAEDAGRKASFFCANCHGETGNSKYTEVPNLAGQHPAYVLNQIEAFLSGKRKDPFMQGLMKVLSAEEKADIAVYFSAQTVIPSARPGARAAEGRTLFQQNCARCHGPEAKGGENFPRLAGQQPEYLRRSLTRYLKMTGERIYPPMTAAVTGLGERNIDAVVDFLSSLN